MDIIKSIENQYMKTKKPVINVGNTVKVFLKIKEGDKERIQVFEGIIIKRKGTGVNETFTVRKISAHGVGVERTFLVNSPKIEKVEVTKIGKTRRAKLYYLRDRVGKRAKLRENIFAVLKGASNVEKEVEETIAEAVEAEAEIKVAEVAEKVSSEPEKKEVVKEEESVEEPVSEAETTSEKETTEE